MFLHDSHLPQVLSAEDYTSRQQYDCELRKLFLPSWQLVGTTAQIAAEGDYFTAELLGYPLIVWNVGGKVRAFLNVCPHRFSRVQGGCGNAGDRLRCQYHGWEFDSDGTTRKIPDARSFKPMTKGDLGLQPVRAETVGQLVFVNLSGDAPSLPESLGPACDVARRLCSAEHVNYQNLEITVEANWKVKIENSLESYHHDMVHPETFGYVPKPEACEHELNDGWTKFTCRERTEGKLDALLDRAAHRLARVEPDYDYKHWLFYPNLMFAKVRLFSWAEVVWPLSPTRLSIRTAFFCNPGTSRKRRTGLLQKALAAWGRRFFTKVAYEDVGIVAEVQQGLSSRRQPSEGVISVREERIFHFQEYVRRMTAGGASVSGQADHTFIRCATGSACPG